MTLNTSASDRTLARIALTGAVVFLAAAWFAKPGESAWLPSCPVFEFTGLYCPGCGTTRMLVYLVHGQLIESFRANPLTFLVLPVVLYSLIRKSITSPLPTLPHISRRWSAGFAVLIILFTVARNIPVKPFCKLSPNAVCDTTPGP